MKHKHTQINYLMLVITLAIIALFLWMYITATNEPPSADSGNNLLVTSIMVVIVCTLAYFISPQIFKKKFFSFYHIIMKKFLRILLIIVVVWGGLRLINQKTNRFHKPAKGTVIGMANPASLYCLDNGGSLEMKENKKGQYGVCYFDDNRQCEERALYRWQCPMGGLKVTGYENDAEVYCAITGGEPQGVGTDTPMCKRTDGTLCNAQANLDGDCPDPNDPNPNAGNVEAE